MQVPYRQLSILNSDSGDEACLKILDLSELERDGTLAIDTLSTDERQRADRMRFERDRIRFSAFRAALRETLGEALSRARTGGSSAGDGR